jgi:hypothetical protein
MALPTAADFKSYARIQTDAEDFLISLLLQRAYGVCESFMGKPIARTADVYYDEARTERWNSGGVLTLYPPMFPYDISTLVVRDRSSAVVSSSTYYVDPQSYLIISNRDNMESFDKGPYQLSMVVGIATSPTYVTREEPVLSQCILDVALMYYQQRTPNATSEAAGGSTVNYNAESLPTRVKALLSQVRGFVLAP